MRRKVLRNMKLDMSKGTPGVAYMGELFTLLRDYGTPEDDDKYWQELLVRSERVVSKYEKYPELKDIVGNTTRGLLTGLDFKAKGSRNAG